MARNNSWTGIGAVTTVTSLQPPKTIIPTTVAPSPSQRNKKNNNTITSSTKKTTNIKTVPSNNFNIKLINSLLLVLGVYEGQRDSQSSNGYSLDDHDHCVIKRTSKTEVSSAYPLENEDRGNGGIVNKKEFIQI